MGNKYKQDTALFYNKYWEAWNDVYDGYYDSTLNTSFHMPRRRSIILQLIDEYAGNNTLRVIDVGCGTGVILKDILEHGHYAVGVDISKKMVEITRKATSELCPGKSTCLQGDIESLPFESGSFDCVICAGVLSHLTSDDNSISEISRIVKRGGIVLVTLPNIWKLRNLLDFYCYLLLIYRLIYKILSSRPISKPSINRSVGYNPTLRKYYYGQLNNMFLANGLKGIKSVSCGYGPLTFWKKEIFPIGWSIKLSNFLEELASSKLLNFLKFIANSWIIYLEKTR